MKNTIFYYYQIVYKFPFIIYGKISKTQGTTFIALVYTSFKC